ncbi:MULTISPECIES: hypothetical protein [unclassified Mycobacterium]|uniref:hypothetical protein n=1 Tax=unclassified Mycobacterium TaxID=2642494 RepID=UPI000AEB8597|nr:MULTISPECIES: hypothetical protein [unclassified Mycobacterium]
MTMTTLKRFAAGAVMAGALGITSAGLGAGQAVADDEWWWWDPPSPGHFVPSPGHISHIPGVPPPGHWDKPWKWGH